ncbi:hypothetical protein [Oceanobacillus indicireducens]|uniref:Uncharacterized protein n=1 Tax=Oceanobacillus indicireducens TaxID=1004261 RepID=A0A917XW64_9BACI|nr:hypothetical protein [Oceanobacillus indicireducens]GGN54128.1 hypothetical protein GCM10007971_11420 [Oceanobacillus indicireducens]
MTYESYIKNSLQEQGLPVIEFDIPFIQDILMTVKQAEYFLVEAPYLNMEVPIQVVDKELLT